MIYIICSLLFYILFPNIIYGKVIPNCQIGNYCNNRPCSTFGNCNFDIINYYKQNSTEEDKAPRCECFIGYSSYDVNVLKSNGINCCYKQKSQLTGVLLEMFIGFGAGHFYMGRYIYGIIKLLVQLFLCFVFWCVTYFACNREHTFEIPNELTNNENISNITNENNNNEVKNENENNENKNLANGILEENENEEDSNEKKKKESFELEKEEENEENDIKIENFIKCPKLMFIIYSSGIAFVVFYFVDIFLIGFGFFKDGEGEDLLMWA